MTTAPARPTRWRSTCALMLSIVIALGGSLIAAAPASATTSDVTATQLGWGFKESWRGYMQYGGVVTTSDGATVVDGPFSAYNWAPVAADFDAATGAGSASFAGTVQFTNVAHGIDLTISSPRVEIAGDGTGTLFWVAGGVEVLGATIASLHAGEPVDSAGVSAISITGTGVAFTEAGGAPFNYAAATPLDDLAFGLSYATPVVAPDAPSLLVSKTSGLDAEGEQITVTGTNIVTGFVNTHVRPGVVNEAGVYAQIGYLDELWKPSQGAAAESRSQAFSTWVKEEGEAPRYTVWSDNGDGTADFSWTVTVTKAELDAVARDGATLAVFTAGAGGVVQPANELAVPITFAAAETPAPETPQPETPQPETPAPAVPVAEAPSSAGSLTWGIKQSFRNYVAGPIAHGTISATGAASVGGAFVFAQASGGSFVLANETGTSNYSGAVNFFGHEGALDLTLSNPRVHVTSSSAATLSVLSNGTRVTVANLALSAGARSVSGGAVTYRGVPATLTSQGTAVFSLDGSPFYEAGTALDPVTFTIGAPASAAGGTTIVASFTQAAASTPAATPPATTGLAVDGDLVEGGEVTITGDGFEANEADILVVIYSEPTVLARDAKADANGTVTWTGTLPEGLTGEHTITLQGSVDRGLVITIPEAMMTTTAATCAVSNATLSWGFKEAFRSYISGGIARGEWTVGGGASYETPLFGWSDGAGSYDAATSSGEVAFAGSMRFTGHGGILDTTLSNPRIEFVDATTAYLVLDISGDTRDGETVDQAGIRFVEIDVAAATMSTEGGVLSIDGAPTTLTEAGHAAFGTYEAGTEFDPIAVSFPLADGCDAAPSAAPGEAEPTPAPDIAWMLWVALAIIVLLAAALVVVLVRNRAVGRA